MERKQPTFPWRFSRSCSSWDDSTALRGRRKREGESACVCEGKTRDERSVCVCVEEGHNIQFIGTVTQSIIIWNKLSCLTSTERAPRGVTRMAGAKP